MADSTIVANGALTFTFTGQFIAGTEVLLRVGGDSTNLVSRTRLADTVTAAAAATACAATLDGLTGVTATALSGVITIGIEAPNTAVTADSAEFYLG